MDGTKLPDAPGVFNVSLDGCPRRATDLREGQMVDKAAFVGLVRTAA